MVWETKDGQKIKIVDMGTQHIVNTRNMLKRQVDSIAEEMDDFLDATHFFDTEIDYDFNSGYGWLVRVRAYWEELIEAFDEELIKRGEK